MQTKPRAQRSGAPDPSALDPGLRCAAPSAWSARECVFAFGRDRSTNVARSYVCPLWPRPARETLFPMRAWLLPDFTGIDTLRLATDAADPAPGAGEVVLDVLFAALNPADRYLA